MTGYSLCAMSESEKNSAAMVSLVSPGSMPSARERPSIAAATPPAFATHAISSSRRAIASTIISLKVMSAAAVIATLSARPRSLSGSAAALSSTAMRCRSISSDWVRSSSTSKRAATSASKGNWCNSRVQNAWMVCTFSPPGVSSACANSRRARSRRAASGLRPSILTISASSSSSESGVHFASSPNTRFAMLAAAAFV